MARRASKTKLFIRDFLDANGCSLIIERYNLPVAFAYTSGDGIFRSDGTLGKEYKFFRFSPRLDFKKVSRCWNLTDEDKANITNIHSSLEFRSKKTGKIVSGGTTVYWIQFFGFGEKIEDKGISHKIAKEIRKLPCANCGTRNDIQCDHKNDLKNDPRVLDTATQIMEDFQPLCRHCNDVKRGVKAFTVRTGKRFGATKMGFPQDFTQGDDTLDLGDPYWYVGTYWGDCLAFKKKLYRT